MRARGGTSAVELIFASALLVTATLPIYTLFQSSEQVAFLDEFQVLARRRAYKVAALLDGHPYEVLAEAATGSAPPSELDDPRLSPGSREVFLPLPEGGLDVTLENLPKAAREYYLRRVATVPARAFFEELEPGFGRLAVLVTWVDPVSNTGRHLVHVHHVEHPYTWRWR